VTVYRHISAERAHCALPVSLMCELLGVSESGYWAWARRPPSDRELTDAWLTERIRAIHASIVRARDNIRPDCGAMSQSSARDECSVLVTGRTKWPIE
jgi:hypothetical protein